MTVIHWVTLIIVQSWLVGQKDWLTSKLPD